MSQPTESSAGKHDRRGRAVRDLITVIMVGMISVLMLVVTDRLIVDLHKVVDDFLSEYQRLQADEFLFAFPAIAVLFCWYSWRRWMDYKRESQSHLESIAELRSSRNRFDNVVNSVTDIVYVADAKTFGATYINHAIETSLGFTPEEWLADPDLWYTQLHEDDREQVESTFSMGLSHQASFSAEYRLWHKDGQHVHWFEDRVSVAGDDQDRPVTFYGTMTDVTARKEAEEHILREKKRAEEYLDIAGTMIVAIDTTGRIERANKKAHQVLGYEPGELVGRNWFDTAIPEDLREAIRSVHAKVVSGEVEGVEYYENEILNKCGERRLVAWQNTMLRDEHGNVRASLSSGEDITEWVETQKSLLHAQKMESIGSMAGGIAHDFRNLLTPIVALTEMTIKTLPEEGRGRVRLEKVIEAAEKAKDLVAKIMSFSHFPGDAPKLKEVDAYEVVEAALPMLHSTMPSSVTIEDRMAPSVGRILCEPSQITSVLMNLGSNAVDAMDGKTGKLTISLAREEIGDGLTEIIGLPKPGAYARLSVSDTGSGMDQKTIDRIFDPFYTTKDVGHGTGLGLAMIHGIIKKHGGGIGVASEKGVGTTFDIYIPLAQATEQ
ncbi:PAS domain S-box protein [Pseudomonadota bacterium]